MVVSTACCCCCCKVLHSSAQWLMLPWKQELQQQHIAAVVFVGCTYEYSLSLARLFGPRLFCRVCVVYAELAAVSAVFFIRTAVVVVLLVVRTSTSTHRTLLLASFSSGSCLLTSHAS